MFLQSLSDYINANAPMTNIPELIGLHHSNPLGLHPLVIPILLLLLAAGMHITTNMILYKNRRTLYPLLYALAGVTLVATYYYCFSGDLPVLNTPELHSSEICIGWFCQQPIVGLGWSLVGVALLTYVVYCFMKALMYLMAHLSESMGVAEKQWIEWQYIIFVMLLGASVAGVADDTAPIVGVWVMLVYQILMILMIIAKMVMDVVRSHNFWHSLLMAVCFFIGIEAVNMLAIECIEGCIYLFIPIVCVFATISVRYKKKLDK